jgi:hypothetical protein
MTTSSRVDPRLRLTVGFLLVVLGTPLLLGPVAPLAVLGLALGAYALVPSGSRPAQRWKAPLATVGALGATATVGLLLDELLPSGLEGIAAVVGGAAAAVGTLMVVRAARGL